MRRNVEQEMGQNFLIRITGFCTAKTYEEAGQSGRLFSQPIPDEQRLHAVDYGNTKEETFSFALLHTAS